MTAIRGTNVAAPVVPFDTADTYPTHDSIYGLGGWREVATTTVRDAIPTERKRTGMIVFVQADGVAYKWTGTAWVTFRRYDLGVFFPGKPAGAQYICYLSMVTPFTLVSGLVGSKFAIRVNPTADLIFTLKQNTTTIGTVTFNTSGVASVSFTADIAFAAGDIFAIVNQSVADTSGADVGFTFVGAL